MAKYVRETDKELINILINKAKDENKDFDGDIVVHNGIRFFVDINSGKVSRYIKIHHNNIKQNTQYGGNFLRHTVNIFIQ